MSLVESALVVNLLPPLAQASAIPTMPFQPPGPWFGDQTAQAWVHEPAEDLPTIGHRYQAQHGWLG
jgi:hypothetical protein